MPQSSIGPRALADLLTGWQSETKANYLALAERLRLLVIDGRVPVGTQLPSERELALVLGISRSSITAAFDELRGSRYIESRRGTCSRVRLPLRTPEGGTMPDAIDLACAAAAAAPGVDAASARAAERLPAFLTSPGYYPQGLPETRAAIAARYTAAGAPTTPDEIIVTSGAQAAIALIAQALVRRGDRVVVETPGYPNAFAAFRVAGARLVATPVDSASGWERSLPLTLRKGSAEIAYLTPDFQNPTGASMFDDFRVELLSAATAGNVTLVIDEATAELNIDRPFTTTPFAALAPHASNLITVGSASKAFWGGMRVGWIRVSTPVIAKLLAKRPAADLGTPVFEQLMATEVLNNAESILHGRRDNDRTQRDTLTGELRRAFPDWTVPDVHGGIALWVQLPAAASSALAITARDHGVLIPAGPWFGLGGTFERFLRIPFTAAAPELVQAIGRLVPSWADTAQNLTILPTRPLHAVV